MLRWWIALSCCGSGHFSSLSIPFSFSGSIRLSPHEGRIGAWGLWWRKGGVSVLISIDINLINLNLMTQCAWTVDICHGILIWGIKLNRFSEFTLTHSDRRSLARRIINYADDNPVYLCYRLTSENVLHRSTKEACFPAESMKESERGKAIRDVKGKDKKRKETQRGERLSLSVSSHRPPLLFHCLSWWIGPSVRNN